MQGVGGCLIQKLFGGCLIQKLAVPSGSCQFLRSGGTSSSRRDWKLPGL